MEAWRKRSESVWDQRGRAARRQEVMQWRRGLRQETSTSLQVCATDTSACLLMCGLRLMFSTMLCRRDSGPRGASQWAAAGSTRCFRAAAASTTDHSLYWWCRGEGRTASAGGTNHVVWRGTSWPPWEVPPLSMCSLSVGSLETATLTSVLCVCDVRLRNILSVVGPDALKKSRRDEERAKRSQEEVSTCTQTHIHAHTENVSRIDQLMINC